MTPDPDAIALRVSLETGLPFTGKRMLGQSQPTLEFVPAGYLPTQTFSLRASIGWRSLLVRFEPGAFAADLVAAMGHADQVGMADFAAVLSACVSKGGAVEFRVNGRPVSVDGSDIWGTPWTAITLELRKGQIPIGVEGPGVDQEIISEWVGRLAAAVVSLLPLEATETVEPEVLGFPEGAKIAVEANRYERDRRNRAAALAIHGHACRACGTLLSNLYGAAAAGFIEVHHLTPVSVLGDGYVIDPKNDLAPLCPNCHGVAHRRTPPFTIEEIQEMLAAAGRAQEG